MSEPDWVPRREWEIEPGTVVLDTRGDGETGTVLTCDRFGHFADPYWLASVRWPGGGVEQRVNTIWLTREDGSQGKPRG